MLAVRTVSVKESPTSLVDLYRPTALLKGGEFQ